MPADDLKHLTDQHESMAFRRRGYERDALLQAVVERAGYAGLADNASEQKEGRQLATLPDEVSGSARHQEGRIKIILTCAVPTRPSACALRP